MYFCPCCGYQTFPERPAGTYWVCSICFWEDTEESWGLRHAQINFVHFGACEREWIEQVRCPAEQDERDPNWQLLDEKIKADGATLIQQVMTAFQGVKRDGGISLSETRQIYLIEDFAYNFSINSSEAKALLDSANATDADIDWQEVSDDQLEKFLNNIFTTSYYLDPIGWRYYLPAIIIFALRRFIDRNCDYFDVLICCLMLQEKHEVLDRVQQKLHQHPWSDYFSLLTEAQLAAICKVLQFVINYLMNWKRTREIALKAMEQYCRDLCQSNGAQA